MKKLLITVRHPGPTQAIIPMIPILCKEYDVLILACYSSLNIMRERYAFVFRFARIVFLSDGIWHTANHIINDKLIADAVEYTSSSDSDYIQLINKIRDLISKERIDIALRTTPSMHYGVDEALPEACAMNNIPCFCYQDDYGCGIELDKVKNRIAVVDEKAGELLQKPYCVVGWLNQSLFKHFNSYSVSRKNARQKIQFDSEHVVVLYCMTASSNDACEFSHFRDIINGDLSTHCKLLYKFHPRNSPDYRAEIRKIAKGNAEELENSLFYDEIISLPDYIVSPGSIINQDSLQYQIESKVSELKTLSIYTKGIITSQIINSACGLDNIPRMNNGMGSMIVPENMCFKHIESTYNNRERLFEESKSRFDLDEKERIQRFLTYLDGGM